MKFFLLFFSFLVAILLEGTIVQLPFVLLLLLCIAVVYREAWIFPLAGASGLLLDSISFKTLGTSSIFFLIFILVIFLYEQKFEIRTFPFVIGMSFLGSLSFFLIFGHIYLILQLLISIMLGGIFFLGLSSTKKKVPEGSLPTWKK